MCNQMEFAQGVLHANGLSLTGVNNIFDDITSGLPVDNACYDLVGKSESFRKGFLSQVGKRAHAWKNGARK